MLERSGSGSAERGSDNAIDAIARGLASGMSRREALRKGGAALLGAAALTPSDAWAAATGRCPRHRVRCAGSCCPAGEVCLPPKRKHGKRQCGCPAHTTRCGGQCLQLQSDVHNCGRCGHKCASGQLCLHGQCACPAGDIMCAGACITVAHDPNNCGACGHRCGPNQVCAAGQCATECPPGQTNCNGACVDLGSNPQHCGACASAMCRRSGLFGRHLHRRMPKWTDELQRRLRGSRQQRGALRGVRDGLRRRHDL